MVSQWDFLTGSPAQLRAVWKAYHVYVQIQAGQIDHTPALYVIGQRGREEKLYLTQMAYASVGQQAQVLAKEAASLLPGHPRLASQRSLAYIGGLGPTSRAGPPALPRGAGIPRPRAQPVRPGGTARQPAAAHRGGRGSHRAIPRCGACLPEEAGPAAGLPGRPRYGRAPRRRVRGAGPAVVRAHLSLRQDRVAARRLAPGPGRDRCRPQGLTRRTLTSPAAIR